MSTRVQRKIAMANKIITPRQGEVLLELRSSYTGVLFRPVHTLELLQKKGMVAGDKRRGWKLTSSGLRYIEALP